MFSKMKTHQSISFLVLLLPLLAVCSNSNEKSKSSDGGTSTDRQSFGSSTREMWQDYYDRTRNALNVWVSVQKNPVPYYIPGYPKTYAPRYPRPAPKYPPPPPPPAYKPPPPVYNPPAPAPAPAPYNPPPKYESTVQTQTNTHNSNYDYKEQSYGQTAYSIGDNYAQSYNNFIPINRFNHIIKPATHAYDYEFESANGIRQQEAGYMKKLPANYASNYNNYGHEGEGSGLANVKTGSVSWISPEGIPVAFRYIADENGYRVSGTHVHTPLSDTSSGPVTTYQAGAMDSYMNPHPYGHTRTYENSPPSHYMPKFIEPVRYTSQYSGAPASTYTPDYNQEYSAAPSTSYNNKQEYPAAPAYQPSSEWKPIQAYQQSSEYTPTPSAPAPEYPVPAYQQISEYTPAPSAPAPEYPVPTYQQNSEYTPVPSAPAQEYPVPTYQQSNEYTPAPSTPAQEYPVPTYQQSSEYTPAANTPAKEYPASTYQQSNEYAPSPSGVHSSPEYHAAPSKPEYHNSEPTYPQSSH